MSMWNSYLNNFIVNNFKIQKKMKFNTIKEAINDLQKWKIIIVVDDENRENEWDFLMSAEYITAENINFITKVWRGLVCVSITEQMAKKLDLSLMVVNNTDIQSTNFTVSVDHKITNTTWISAFDRANTIKAMTLEESKSSDFSRPGHIFPLIARKWWVIERPWHTEAVIDLMKLSWLKHVGVLCEILKDDWNMARVLDLFKISKIYNLKIITIKDLIEFIKK